jgi:hypothetical protein
MEIDRIKRLKQKLKNKEAIQKKKEAMQREEIWERALAKPAIKGAKSQPESSKASWASVLQGGRPGSMRSG